MVLSVLHYIGKGGGGEVKINNNILWGFFPDDISDDFFEVTVNDLRLMLKDLKSERYTNSSPGSL